MKQPEGLKDTFGLLCATLQRTLRLFFRCLWKGTCQCTVNLSELSTRLRVERIAYPQPAMLSPKRASNMRNAAKAIALPKIEASPIIWRTISQKHHLGRTLARTTATLKTRYPTKRASANIRKVAM